MAVYLQAILPRGNVSFLYDNVSRDGLEQADARNSGDGWSPEL